MLFCNDRRSFTLTILGGACFWLALGTLPGVSQQPEKIHPPKTNGKNGDTSKEVKKESKDDHKEPALTLAQCLRIAAEKQPKLRAVRAGLISAEASQAGLNDIRWIGNLVVPDLKYRKEQAARGIQAAQAELFQAEHEVRQAVVWNYYAIVYAREQLKTVSELVEVIAVYQDQVDRIVNSKEGGNRDINQNTLDALNAALARAKLKGLDAKSGVRRAFAALREAMGVSQDFQFDIAETELPTLETALNKEIVRQLAVTRRGEVILAGIASEVTRLEIFCQWAYKYRIRTTTFATSVDIHSQLIPGGNREGEYRPDAIAPEMPHHLVGSQANRVLKAKALNERAMSVLEKTKALVDLEAENALIQWEVAGEKTSQSKKAVEASRELLNRMKRVAGEEGFKTATIEMVLKVQAEYAAAKAEYNEARYQRIVNIANLERITAGGLRVAYPDP